MHMINVHVHGCKLELKLLITKFSTVYLKFCVSSSWVLLCFSKILCKSQTHPKIFPSRTLPYVFPTVSYVFSQVRPKIFLPIGRQMSEKTSPYSYIRSQSYYAPWDTPADIIASVSSVLGRVALVAQWPIVVKLSRGRSVGPYVRTCVGRSVCPVHCGKTADRIRMPFGVIGRTGPGMRQVVEFGDRFTGKGTFGARHCNQWGLYGVCMR